MPHWVTLGDLAEIPENGNKAFQVGARSLLVCRSGDAVYTIDNQCSHALQPLEGGRIRGGHICCPLHGVRFNLQTGVPLGEMTRIAIRTYPSRVEQGRVQAELS